MKWVDKFFDSNWPLVVMFLLLLFALFNSCSVEVSFNITGTEQAQED